MNYCGNWLGHINEIAVWQLEEVGDVLTKYIDIVVQHSSSETVSAMGQSTCQSPGPGYVFQNFCRIRRSKDSVESIVTSSSSNQDHLPLNDQELFKLNLLN